jgi:hypothetical protein
VWRPADSQSLLVLLKSFEDRKRDPWCDRVWTRIPRTIAHAKADCHHTVDFFGRFSAEGVICPHGPAFATVFGVAIPPGFVRPFL